MKIINKCIIRDNSQVLYYITNNSCILKIFLEKEINSESAITRKVGNLE